MKYRSNEIVEAVSFQELIEIALSTDGSSIVNGVPWSFQYQDYPFTHENDDLYLFIVAGTTQKFRRGDFLVTDASGALWVMTTEVFHDNYVPAMMEPDSKGVELIAAERVRQINVEGWTPESDDEHTIGELLSAAVCYTVAGDSIANGAYDGYEDCTPERLLEGIRDGVFGNGVSWPWEWDALKISKDPVRDLAKAGALIAAEIDRLTRRDSMKKIVDADREEG